MLGDQLGEARRAYQYALELGGSRHPMRLALPLFCEPTFANGHVAKPYEPISPGVWLGYNGGTDFRPVLSSGPSHIGSDPKERDFSITFEGNAPDWLGLEISLDHQFLRPAKKCSVTIYASCKKQNREGSSGAVEIYYHDTSGQHYSALPNGPAPIQIGTEFSYQRTEFPVYLNPAHAINFDRPAIIAILLPRESRKITFADLSIDFEE